MSYPVYQVYAGDVLPVFFDTFDGGTGASLTMTGLAVTDIEIYKDGSTTQRASDAGYTLLDTDGIDFDGLTGIHGFSIDTGDNTDAGFFSVGSWFHVVVSSITVDGQTVNFIACAFRIMVAETIAGAPKVDVHAVSNDTTAADNLELMFDGTGYAGGTTKLDVNVATIANNAITAASIATGAIDADAIADNAIDAGAIASDAITAAKIANGAIDAATFAADVDAEIATMVWNAATDSYGGAGTYGQAVEDVRDDTNELQTDWHDGGRLDILLDGASAPSAADVADAVWDEALAGHAGAGSTGAALTAAGSAGDPWATALPGSYGAGTAGVLLGTTIPNAIDAIDNYVDTEIGTLTTELAKVPKSDSNVSFNATAIAAIQNGLATPTNITAGTITTVTNLTNAPANGDFTATMKSSITAAVPTAAAISDAVWDEASTGHTDAGKAGAQMWTVLDDVPNTSEFQARTLAAADYTVVSDLGTVQTGDSFARLGAPAGANVSADIASIKSETAAIVTDTNELQTDDTPAALAAVKTVVDLVEDILRNKMEITDANGNLVLYEDDGTTPKYSVSACVVDNSTTTTRKRLA